MIISASRRTDIPAFYIDWLFNRIAEGYVKTKNPLNPSQIRTVFLTSDDIDCFVFWTKNPASMMPKLHILNELNYNYYFQFSLTPYGRDLEQNLPPKSEITKTFQELSGAIGRQRVIWRYDPIILNDEWDIQRHIETFQNMCGTLGKYTERVIISFVDLYKKIHTDKIRAMLPDEMEKIASCFSDIASTHSLEIFTCCEDTDFTRYGIQKAACIDKALIERIIGRPVVARSDSNQRNGCGCCQSVDIGVYNTCGNGCVYCYANYSPTSTRKNMLKHDAMAEFLIE